MTAFFFSRLLPLSLAGSAASGLLLVLSPLTRAKFSSRWQYYSWMVVLLLFALPVTAFIPAQAAQVSPVIPPLTAIAGGLADMAEPPIFAEPALRFFLPWRELLAAVWFAGAAVFLYRKLLAAVRFRRALRHASQPVSDSETLACFAACCAQRGVRRRIELRSCPPACAPMLVGILRPRIILPEVPLGGEELRLVFLHELTHYKHGDLLYKFAAMLIGAAHWFNPLARLISGRLDALCELACDETLSCGMEPEERRGYGMAILSVMGEARLAPPVSTSFSLSKQDVKRRLTLIMDYKRPTRGLIAAGICSISLLAFVGVSVSAYVLPDNASAAKPKASVIVEEKIKPATSEAGSAAEKLAQELTGTVKIANGKLIFTIPPKTSLGKWAINAAGTAQMGDGQMSVHLFEQESADKSWVAGKTYSAPLDLNSIIEFTFSAELVNAKGQTLAESFVCFASTEYSPKAKTADSQENPFGEKIDLPVKDGRLTAGFGAYYGHTGADFSGPGIMGRDISAVADGTVVYSNYSGAYGNYIVLDHGNGVHTLYAQCDELKVKMSKDGTPVTVKKGDVIATVGRSGNSTGPHLHFEVRVKGEPVDPEPFLK